MMVFLAWDAGGEQGCLEKPGKATVLTQSALTCRGQSI